MMHEIRILSASPSPRVPASSSARRAFTLIEILCVVVIIGIASAIIVPQISTRDDLRCAAAARALMADLLYAQNRSIALQKMHYVQFDTGTGTYQVLDSLSPANVITHPVNGTPYTVTVGTGSMARVSINSASFDNQVTLGFDAMGVPYSVDTTGNVTAMNAGSVVFKAGVCQMTVTVKPYSGEITVQ
ncbi:MAG TPA: type II secretion system protein [Tepidisphaeraceae bacterium]|nr:type II secretion system protein [Tepidisphaeraceae bacterium]